METYLEQFVTLNDGVDVDFSQTDMERIERVAMQRSGDRTSEGKSMDKHGHPDADSDTLHRWGCCGEWAVSKAIGEPWTGDTPVMEDDDDVNGYQVRTAQFDTGKLIIRNQDLKENHDDVFILVAARVPFSQRKTHDMTKWRVVGWIYCREAKLMCELWGPNGREAAYFVPQHRLHPMSTLPKIR